MDATILIVGLVFAGLVWAVIYFIKDDFPKTTKKPQVKPETPVNKNDGDLSRHLQKKLAQTEEKCKNMELQYEAAQLELSQTKDKEKNLLKAKAEDVFDREQYEKFKKEFQILKKEVADKEESLEKEIGLRRQQSSQLTSTQQERDDLQKRASRTEDAHRKALASIESLTKELQDLKRKVREQGRIVEEHAVSKTEGEWISRAEFDKVEKELQEKELLIRKMLSINKEPNP
jgi:predicted  nucleic acid-binding Zn-ribbon protein